MKNKYKKALDKISSCLIEYEYCNGDIVSKYSICEDEQKLIKELVKRASPKKPIIFLYQGQISNFICPVCEYALGYRVMGFLPKYKAYCPCCGQALDWSENV